MVLFDIMYILVFAAFFAGALILGDPIMKVALRLSPRLRRFFDELPMNREEDD